MALMGGFQLVTTVLLAALAVAPASRAAAHPTDDHAGQQQQLAHLSDSYWYTWGWYGSYPRKSYESFGAESPLFNIIKKDDRCDDSLVFIEPRGRYVETPGPVITDGDGNLVWTETKWGQAMDVKVQSYKGKDYITFWIGEDVGTFAGGVGSYLMIDDSYQVFKEVTPVGDLTGDLHEFSITENGTALMTIYEAVKVAPSGKDGFSGWIYDCLFQEIDLDSGKLLFEWRATDHYPILDSLQPVGRTGSSAENGFDFFHINSIDKNSDGDYLISARHMCSVSCVSHVDGSVLWQLGGQSNSFEDLSGGRATNIAWNHHASWYQNSSTVTIFDNESNGAIRSGDSSRGVMVSLDLDAMTATLAREYVAPLGLLAPSQGSVQVLPSGNVLVGWGHTAAFTEYSMDGEVLCDTHFGPVWFANFGWVKSYRNFKFPWVGRPVTKPDVAVRPGRRAVFVSWNGATEVRSWVLQSAPSPPPPNHDDDGNDTTIFASHGEFPKTTFETMMTIPDDAGDYLRVAALDADGAVLAHTATVSRHERTETPLLEAPWRGWIPEPLTIFLWSLCGFLLVLAAVIHYRATLRRAALGLIGKTAGVRHAYEPLPLR